MTYVMQWTTTRRDARAAAWIVFGLLAAQAAGCGWIQARPKGSEPISANQPLPPAAELAAEDVEEPPVFATLVDKLEENQGEQAMFQFTSAAKSGGAVEHANDRDFQEKVLQSDVPVLVDFYADWCGPCRMLAPVLDEVARETPGARVVKVNVDDSPQVARRYRVSSIPALFVFQGGQPVANRVGAASKGELQQMLQR